MRILVVGIARSGTTWMGKVLGETPDAALVKEPDDSRLVPFTGRALRGLAGNPVLEPGDRATPAYIRLWDAAFGAPMHYVRGQQRFARRLFDPLPNDVRVGRTPARGVDALRLRLAQSLAVPRHPDAHSRHQVVKSVRIPFAVEWVYDRWRPKVVVCRRHPLDVVASRLMIQGPTTSVTPESCEYARSRFEVQAPETDDPVTLTAWVVGLTMSALDRARQAHPEFLVVDHETLCEDPIGTFRDLAASLGLEWTPACEDFVAASNRPGSGYELNRVAGEQPGKWRRLLSTEDAATAGATLAQFPIAERYVLS